MNNTRRQIIETAFLLFLKKGFKAVRLSDIERAAKITRGTFYYHFTNKEEVLKEGLYSYYALLNSKRTEEPKNSGIFRHCGNMSTSLFRN